MLYINKESMNVLGENLECGDMIVLKGKFYSVITKTTAFSLDGELANLFDKCVYEKILKGVIKI